MSESRVVAPQIDPANKPKGPASYFPSIKAKYGKPLQHWLDVTVEILDNGNGHMEAVSILKSEHHLGHGHANALVSYVRAKIADAD